MIRVDALAGTIPLVESSAADPIPLNDGEELDVTLNVTNVTSVPVDIASVELEGRLLGLPVVSSRTGIDETVLPGEERLIRFPVDLHGIDAQAHGLLRGRLVVSGPDGRVLDSQPAILDVHGSPVAVTSALVLALFAVGGIGLAAAVVRLAAGTLPDERRLRGLQFAPAGIAFGLGLSAVSSVARLWPLPAPVWLFMTTLIGLGFYAVGVYLPPFSRYPRIQTIDLTTDHGEREHPQYLLPRRGETGEPNLSP